MNTRAMAAAALAETAFWLRCAGRLLRRFPGQAAVAVAVIWLFRPPVPTLLLVGAGCLVAGLRFWALRGALSFHRRLKGPVVRTWHRLRIHSGWPEVAHACGLAVQPTLAVARGEQSRPERAPGRIPLITKVRAEGPRVSLRLRPLMGQTMETFEQASEQLRIAAGATRVRVEPVGVNEVLVTFTMGDALASPFTAAEPDAASTPCPDRVLMGRVEDGSPWWLPVGPHTLVAGMSGSGKGSVFWSFAFGLASAVRAGTVQLHGIDLKGGMEILMGASLFTTRATDASEAVALLEQLVGEMRDRTKTYAGRVRAHEATLDEPLHVVMIDELAALTAYCPERELQRRAEMAINLLCSQGRAPGFMVFACLQDPRKEVIPSRGLFTQMIGLRLKDANETLMVLGETALTSGAHCHRITRGTPGMGYVVPEEGGYPMRVRAGFAPDAAIRSVASAFATPTQTDLPPLESLQPTALRRSRSTRGSEVA